VGPPSAFPRSFPPFAPVGHFHGGRPFGMRGPFSGRHHGPYMGALWGAADSKLYARFVCDVTVFAGTEVVSGTHFVKIWRLRNSGTAPWPVNTTLVFVGGDELGHVAAVPLEIPEQGLAPEAEMEVSVDMVAPEKPGRYVSHWRLASPAGPKFGQRLSVVIQVVPKATVDGPPALVSLGDDAPAKEAVSTTGTSSQSPGESADVQVNNLSNNFGSLTMLSFGNLEDNTKAADTGGEAEIDEEDQDQHQLLLKNLNSILDAEYGGGSFITSEVGENNIPTEAEAKGLGVGTSTEEEKVAEPKITETSPAVEGGITYPVVEVTEDQGPITYPVVDALATDLAAEAAEPAAEGEDLSTAKASLAKLEAMGFSDSKLNAELLEKNGFDLRKTLDDLCAAEEWDPILEELEEMGFYDTVMNRRLMFKNNGSVKRVVKELVQMYRDLQGKREKVE
jgi:next-to-BRCA1 protein 1